MAAFLVTVSLLVVFVRSQDWSILCLAAASFAWMGQQLLGASFYFKYFPSEANTLVSLTPLIATLALLCFLTLRGGTHKKWLWVPVGGYALSVAGCFVIYAVFPYFVSMYSSSSVIAYFVPYWLACISLGGVLVLGAVRWRKENQFYRVFMPLAFAGIALCWAFEIIRWKGEVWNQIVTNLTSGQVLYIFARIIPGVTFAALISALAEAIKAELNRRSEMRLLKQHQELAFASYESLRRQHEEVMMLRHDMMRHFTTLRGLDHSDERHSYLDKLIGDNEKIHPVIQSGNKLFDIILNSKIGSADAKGINVEVIRADIPQKLPLSDSELCSLLMNLLDNAIAAASEVSGEPQIELDMHLKGSFFVFTCSNSMASAVSAAEQDDPLQEHGLGLKIVQRIADSYNCLIQVSHSEKNYTVTLAIPLERQ